MPQSYVCRIANRPANSCPIWLSSRYSTGMEAPGWAGPLSWDLIALWDTTVRRSCSRAVSRHGYGVEAIELGNGGSPSTAGSSSLT